MSKVASRALIAMKKTSLDLLGNPESSLKPVVSPNPVSTTKPTDSSSQENLTSQPSLYIFESKGSFRREVNMNACIIICMQVI